MSCLCYWLVTAYILQYGAVVASEFGEIQFTNVKRQYNVFKDTPIQLLINRKSIVDFYSSNLDPYLLHKPSPNLLRVLFFLCARAYSIIRTEHQVLTGNYITILFQFKSPFFGQYSHISQQFLAQPYPCRLISRNSYPTHFTFLT